MCRLVCGRFLLSIEVRFVLPFPFVRCSMEEEAGKCGILLFFLFFW